MECRPASSRGSFPWILTPALLLTPFYSWSSKQTISWSNVTCYVFFGRCEPLISWPNESIRFGSLRNWRLELGNLNLAEAGFKYHMSVTWKHWANKAYTMGTDISQGAQHWERSWGWSLLPYSRPCLLAAHWWEPLAYCPRSIWPNP